MKNNDKEKLKRVGIDTSQKNRSGSFIMENDKILESITKTTGIEMLPITEAIKKYTWIQNYLWKLVDKEKDDFTKEAYKEIHAGYFIYVKKGIKSQIPFQACFFIKNDRFKQKVHNLIILEDDTELHIINGCAAASYLANGGHIGITEIYIGKNSKLSYTMIHDWEKGVEVRPRTGIKVYEGGVFISNYISLGETKLTQSFPTAYLNGEGSIAKFNSLILSPENSIYDLGARVFLNKKNTKAEIISRSISNGGKIIARGHLIGNAPNIKAHLECDGLMLKNNGNIKAIPELETNYSDVDMSHEAAIGKIDEEQLLYLMSRGFTKEESTSIIVSGFMDVKILGLPEVLEKEVKKNLEILEKSAL